MYTAARIAGLATNNNFGNIAQELVISADDNETDTNVTEFPKVCETLWNKVCSSSKFLVPEIVDKSFEAWDKRSMQWEKRPTQSDAIGRQLAKWKQRYAAEVEEFIATM